MKTIRKTRPMVADQMMKFTDMKEGDQILEPSAGYGDLADGIVRYNPGVSIDCVELNKERRDTLLEKGYNVVGNDFMLLRSNKKYDWVIAAPTFKDNIDCDHVVKMYDHLALGGKIVSIMSPQWMIGSSDRQVGFRKWISNKRYEIGMLEDNSFMEDGNTVPTLIVKIYGSSK